MFVGPEYFLIPRFQRPYSWEPENLEDFWRDVVVDNAVGYFIGPMVAWTEPGSSVSRLVDGQQRLTTISIMFSVLRDALADLSEAKLAEGIDRYIQKRDRDNELRFTLQPEVNAPYLNHGIFKFPPDATVKPSGDEEKALNNALKQIKKKVKEAVDDQKNPVPWLTAVRDKLLGLRVIWVEHSDEDDAYVIFETLNSRGKDLEVADLLKNHLLNKLRGGGNSSADTIRTKWTSVRAELEAAGNRNAIDFNQFILHWWLSQEDYEAKRQLFRAIKGKVKTKTAAQARLNSLASDVKLYRAAVQPESRSWLKEEQDAKRSLEALALFGVVQPAPLSLALMRARTGSAKLNAAQFRRTLQTIERFHFQYTVVSGLSSSGGVSEMYAKAAKDLTNAGTDSQKQADTLDTIRGKLVSRAPDFDVFVTAFMERFYFTSEYTRDAKLVRYVLGAFLRDAHPTTGQDNLTIEHVMNQEEMKTGEPFEVVGVIGNLLLVSDALNGKLGNKKFPPKKKILESAAGKPFDIGGILQETSWTSVEIEARTRLLAETAYTTVWKLPTQ